jgi:hypothetical protein
MLMGSFTVRGVGLAEAWLLSVLLYADDMVLLSPDRGAKLTVMLPVMDKVAASMHLVCVSMQARRRSCSDKNWEEGHGPAQPKQGPGVVISEGVVKEVSQFKYLGSVLVSDGRLDVELNIRKG